MIGWWVILACSQPADPALAAQREAAELADQGETKLAAGDADGARAAFAAARAKHDAPLLEAWEAAAMADGGDLAGAVEVAATALTRAPSLAAARYNRAAWLVRLDRADEAASELQRALADGAAEPLDVLDDPDFASVLAHPAFAFLPQSGLVAFSEPMDATAFLGGELELRLHVEGIVPDVEVVASQLQGPLELVRATEDQATERRVDLTWTFRVLGAGPVVLGPFTVRAGDREATADAVSSKAEAPPGHEAPASTPWLPVPSRQKGAGIAWTLDRRLFVRTGPFDRVDWPVSGARQVRLEQRVAGTPTSLVYVGDAPSKDVEVVVREADGTEKWRGTPERG